LRRCPEYPRDGRKNGEPQICAADWPVPHPLQENSQMSCTQLFRPSAVPVRKVSAALVALVVLGALAGCQDTSGPPEVQKPQFAQGDGGVWTVNSLADPGDATCDDVECSLREAIAAAASGDEIGFAAGLQGDILLTAGQLEIFEKDLTVDGAGRIAVDAQDNSRVLKVSRLISSHPGTRNVMQADEIGASRCGSRVRCVVLQSPNRQNTRTRGASECADRISFR
jgi:CSLREA domain-containing protein